MTGYELGKMLKSSFSDTEVATAAKKVKSPFENKKLKEGMEDELEHEDVTKGDAVMTAKLTLPHLKKDPNYYEKLERLGL